MRWARKPLLPSFLYIPGEREFPSGSVAVAVEIPSLSSLPASWRSAAERRFRADSFRRPRAGYLIPPWIAPPPCSPGKRLRGVPRISPVDASAEYLKHLRAAWDQEHLEDPIDEQEVMVTVPASFDAIARELTSKAAEAAGYRNLTMLEEPQAAFYAWIERHPDWRQRVSKGGPGARSRYRRRHYGLHSDRGYREGRGTPA